LERSDGHTLHLLDNEVVRFLGLCWHEFPWRAEMKFPAVTPLPAQKTVKYEGPARVIPLEPGDHLVAHVPNLLLKLGGFLLVVGTAVG
jgi:hypothetical protein